jgi:hypothetical protein
MKMSNLVHFTRFWNNLQNLKWQQIFYFYVDFFFPLSLPRYLPDLTVYMNNMVDVL